MKGEYNYNLLNVYLDEEINERAFKCLSDDIIRELIPKLGKRAIFCSAYKEFLENVKTKPEPKPESVDCKVSLTKNKFYSFYENLKY